MPAHTKWTLLIRSTHLTPLPYTVHFSGPNLDFKEVA
jgi:hypothetical protein